MSRVAKTKAVVFDLDGTLVDSLPLVLRAIAHAIGPFGPAPTMDIFSHLGGPPERFLHSLVSDARHVPAAVQRLAAYHNENAHLLQLFEGAQTMLGQLRGEGVALGIWTGRDRTSTIPLLRAHGLADLFEVVMCGDDLSTHKPDPEGLREILRRLALPADEAIFVGDADVDVLGGVACGVDTVLIRHARAVPAEIQAKAWCAVTSTGEAYDVVLGCVK
ncbi:MAG: HAD family hydrolase [Opitutus sp.]|nr:HAD family hydrolase [Opitutus sp.]